jgi:lipid II:glycine glycyltransferase (peptidoglycan interpeptide bridge formation enzyme)
VSAATSPPGAPGPVPGPASPAAVDADALRHDDAAWNFFVASTPLAPYLQATPWAGVKARNGWAARRIVTGRTGGQLLTHPIGPLPWSVGYLPRGPISPALDRAGVLDWTDAVRWTARPARLSHVVIDPEIETGGPELAWFRDAGWRPCPSPQPARSRWIDLARSEEALWGDLRAKWRQYVQKARRGGVRVVEAGPERLGDFYAIYVETARRAGFTYRTEATYRATYEAYAAHGRARLLFADGPGGRAEATLMLIGWGRRVVEPYGGMTRAGAESRANYLLKWEAIRASREAGYAIYDLWGLSHAGIEHFKAGFGGREVEYIGGLELPVRRLVRSTVQAVQAGRVIVARLRLRGERPAATEGTEP